MNYTNREGYPDYVKAWLTHDSYDHEEGVLSATRLLAPIRQTLLMKRHETALECDVVDLIASRYGTALHESFEHIPMEGVRKEERFYTTISCIDGTGKPFQQKISGKFDMLVKEGDLFRLVDIKSTSVWTYIYGSRDDDFIKQMSILRYILTVNGFGLHPDAQVVYVFTDWKKSDAKKNPDYPQQRILVKTIPMDDTDKTYLWVAKRVLDIRNFDQSFTDDFLPDCTDAELWRKGDKYAVMKPGRKTAVKVFDELTMAKEFIETNRLHDHTIDHRKGSVNRCHYCLVRKWCNQFENLKAQGLVEEE